MQVITTFLKGHKYALREDITDKICHRGTTSMWENGPEDSPHVLVTNTMHLNKTEMTTHVVHTDLSCCCLLW
jgi:hypothetical protein